MGVGTTQPHPTPQEQGYGWKKDHVSAVLRNASRTFMPRPRHREYCWGASAPTPSHTILFVLSFYTDGLSNPLCPQFCAIQVCMDVQMLAWLQHTSAKLIAVSGNCRDILLTVSYGTWTGRDSCISLSTLLSSDCLGTEPYHRLPVGILVLMCHYPQLPMMSAQSFCFLTQKSFFALQALDLKSIQ